MQSDTCRQYLYHIDHAADVREFGAIHEADFMGDAYDAGAEAEPIDMVRIRLSMSASTTALLSEYRSADKVLEQWASRAGCDADVDTVDYEITFFDGYVMRGCYPFFRRGKLKRSFSSHVRALLRQAAPTLGQSRYLAPA